MQSLQFEYSGDLLRADATEIEVMWGKTNPSTLAQRSTAAKDAKQGGATQRWIDENAFEMTPAERHLAEQDRVTEAFTLAIAGGAGVAADDASR